MWQETDGWGRGAHTSQGSGSREGYGGGRGAHESGVGRSGGLRRGAGGHTHHLLVDEVSDEA